MMVDNDVLLFCCECGVDVIGALNVVAYLKDNFFPWLQSDAFIYSECYGIVAVVNLGYRGQGLGW